MYPPIPIDKYKVMSTSSTQAAQANSAPSASLPIIRGRQQRAQRVVIYGPEGVGKSTLAAGLPAPLFLDTEEGTQHLDVDRVPVATIDDMHATCRALYREAKAGSLPYRTVVIDTGDRLWDMCAAKVLIDNKVESIEAIGYGKGYAQASELFVTLLNILDNLRSVGLHIVVVCHSRVETISPPDTEAYTMYTVKVNAPAKQAANAKDKLREWADAVLFVNFVTTITDSGKAKGGTRRVIYAEHRATWEAKNRHGLPAQMDMTPDALASIFGTPTQSATLAPAAEPDTSDPAPQDADTALLVRYFVALGKLQDGQTLDDLPAPTKSALADRRDAALAKARAWEGGAQ